MTCDLAATLRLDLKGKSNNDQLSTYLALTRFKVPTHGHPDGRQTTVKACSLELVVCSFWSGSLFFLAQWLFASIIWDKFPQRVQVLQRHAAKHVHKMLQSSHSAKQCCHNYLQNIVEQHHRLQPLAKASKYVYFSRTKKYLAPSLVSGLVELRPGLYHCPPKNKMSLIYLFKYLFIYIYKISTCILSGIVQSGICRNQA